MAHTERLMELGSTDPVVLLSFVELARDTPDDRSLIDWLVRATVHVENETPEGFAAARPFDKTQWVQPLEIYDGSAALLIARAAQ